MPAQMRVASRTAKLLANAPAASVERQSGDADLDAAWLAEAVADRAEERLGDRVGQRVGGVEHRRGGRRDGEIGRHRQHDRIGQAQREAAGEGARGEDEEDRHASVSAPRASAFDLVGTTGTPRLMSSQPSAVTTASSSMRMPMFQKRSGTPAAGRT